MGGYTVADRVIYEVGTSSNSLPLILTFPTSMKVGYLYLLEGQSNRFGECSLTGPEQRATKPDADANVNVDRIGIALAGHSAGRLARALWHVRIILQKGHAVS